MVEKIFLLFITNIHQMSHNVNKLLKYPQNGYICTQLSPYYVIAVAAKINEYLICVADTTSTLLPKIDVTCYKSTKLVARSTSPPVNQHIC